MSYLLAKYTLLFLLTAVVAFLLGHWWARRRLIDVTDSYHSLSRSLDSSNRGWDRLWTRLDGLDGSVSSTLKTQIAAIPTPDFPRTDLSGVESKLAALEARIDSLPAPVEPDFSPLTNRIDTVAQSVSEIPKPEATDLSGVESKLAAFEAALMSLPIPQPTDLAPITERLGSLEAVIHAIHTPEAVDLAPVADRLSDLETTIRAIPAPQMPEPLDLAPVHSRLEAVESALRSIPTIETHAAPDLAPLSQRLADLERGLARIPGALPRMDLGSVNTRLASLEESLKSVVAKLDANTLSAPAVPTSGPRLLTHAEYGNPDDLKLISGIGPKLEKLLHRNGVYYFWQIASWSDADVEFVDAQLEVFTGRIARDNWVTQAGDLKNSPSAVRAPE